MTEPTRSTEMDWMHAAETRLRAVEEWKSEHAGACEERRSSNATAINGLNTRVDRHESRLDKIDDRLGDIEKKLAWICGIAAAIGAVVGSLFQ